LSVIGHGIGFVQNNQLVAFVENGFGAGKTENLATDDSNTTVVGGVQLEHHRGELRWCVQLPGACQNRTCFSCTGRSIKQQMRQLVFSDKSVD